MDGGSLRYLLAQVNPQIVEIRMDQFLFKDVQMCSFADLQELWQSEVMDCFHSQQF
jgi:hypothetical protein